MGKGIKEKKRRECNNLVKQHTTKTSPYTRQWKNVSKSDRNWIISASPPFVKFKNYIRRSVAIATYVHSTE